MSGTTLSAERLAELREANEMSGEHDFTKDDRPITSISAGDKRWKVGSANNAPHNVTKIVAVNVVGEMAYVPWFQVYCYGSELPMIVIRGGACERVEYGP
jgi:hypothetical protein